VLTAIIDRGVRNKRLPANPARGVDLPALNEQRRRYLTAVQVSRLAAAAGALPEARPRRASDAAFGQYRIVVLALSHCGIRWSEMAALRLAASI
jgi:hypothetical protein